MGLERVVCRFKHDGNLSDDEQQALVDRRIEDIESLNNSVGGVMVTNNGWDWVEWEGEAADIDSLIQDHLADSDVADGVEYDRISMSSRDYDELVTHADGDVYMSLNA